MVDVQDIKKYLMNSAKNNSEAKTARINEKVHEYLEGKINMTNQILGWIIEQEIYDEKNSVSNKRSSQPTGKKS